MGGLCDVKLEIKYEIEEVTRFRIVRKYLSDTSFGRTVGHSLHYGEFENKADAEKVREALELSVAHRVQEVV